MRVNEEPGKKEIGGLQKKWIEFLNKHRQEENLDQGTIEVDTSAQVEPNYDALSKMPSFDKWRDQNTEIDPNKLELFNKFTDFFKKDSRIKRALSELAPSEQDFYGDEAVRYADKLYEETGDIISDIKSIMQNFYSSEFLEKRLEQIKDDVINAGANPKKLTSVYQRDFASMSEKFNKGIREEVKGYISWGDPHKFDSEASSINEILHLIHSSIVNNEEILQSLPVLESEKGQYGETTLYGTANSKNPIAKEIYDQIKNGDESWTDIVSLPDRTLMMVRDRGHALTIDIEKDIKDDKFYINYFVPKICNVDKVNQLPGVRKVIKREGESQVLEFTTGVFSINNETDVASTVTNFIKMVPTDIDIERTR